MHICACALQDFTPSSSFKRIINKNKDLIATHLPPQTHKDQFALLSQYLDERHQNGGMNNMSIFEYMAMVEDTLVDTHIVEYRDTDNQLVAMCLLDRLSDGISMVYSFFQSEFGNQKPWNLYDFRPNWERTQKWGWTIFTWVIG